MLIERQTHNRKVASSNPGRGGGRILLFRVNFVCWLLFGVRSTTVLACRWRITPKHAYTLHPTKSEWDDYAAVHALGGNLSGNELTRNLSGNTRPQSSQLTEPLKTDPGVKSGISVRELISTSKITTTTTKQETNKRRRGMNGRTYSQNSRKRGKSHHQTSISFSSSYRTTHRL